MDLTGVTGKPFGAKKQSWRKQYGNLDFEPHFGLRVGDAIVRRLDEWKLGANRSKWKIRLTLCWAKEHICPIVLLTTVEKH